MTYVEGFVAAVPSGNKEAYRKHAADAAPLFKDFGATRLVEAWGDDVPDGKVTDYKGAVKAKGDETVVYTWIEWPSKEVRNEGWAKVQADPRMGQAFSAMPFDGQRWVHGGFAPIVDV